MPGHSPPSRYLRKSRQTRILASFWPLSRRNVPSHRAGIGCSSTAFPFGESQPPPPLDGNDPLHHGGKNRIHNVIICRSNGQRNRKTNVDEKSVRDRQTEIRINSPA